jgi:hypothetical protein
MSSSGRGEGFPAKAQRTQRHKGGSSASITPASLTRLCAFAFFAPLREINNLTLCSSVLNAALVQVHDQLLRDDARE